MRYEVGVGACRSEGLSDPYICELFIVKPECVEIFIEFLEESLEGEELRMLPVARAAGSVGEAVCLLHTLW